MDQSGSRNQTARPNRTVSLTRTVRVQLRVLLILAFVLILVAQTVLVPAVGGDLAVSFPEYAYLLRPYAAVVISGFACVQIAAGAAWLLAGLTAPGNTRRAGACATVLAAACGAATLLAVLLAWHLFFVVQQGNPATLFALGAAVVTGAVLTVLAVNLRRRLRPSEGTALRSAGRAGGVRP